MCPALVQTMAASRLFAQAVHLPTHINGLALSVAQIGKTLHRGYIPLSYPMPQVVFGKT
jgi:hypothetical protein